MMVLDGYVKTFLYVSDQQQISRWVINKIIEKTAQFRKIECIVKCPKFKTSSSICSMCMR